MNAINWFEIPVQDIERAQKFYEALLGRALRREQMGESTLAVFPYQAPEGVGGALIADPKYRPADRGSMIYLNLVQATPLAEVVKRAETAGGHVAMECTSLPPGMGVIAHVIDTEGNRVGLHAMA